MKIDKDFKSEVDQSFREADYVGRKSGIRILIVILIVFILSASGGFAYKKWKVDKDREIFKQSITYTESAASFLADSYRKYSQTESQTEKNMIMQYVIDRYPNLDTNEIDNIKLRTFYEKCQIGGN